MIIYIHINQNLLLKLWLMYRRMLVGLPMIDGLGSVLSVLINFKGSFFYEGTGDLDIATGGFGLYSGKGDK
jgi:hypothetical protein